MPSSPDGGQPRSPLASGYQTVARLADGGMGTVWLAVRREGTFRRIYALKRPHPQYRGDPVFRAMFANEARLAGLLRHPNAVSVHDIGEDDLGPYLVMDYVEGLSAARLITDLGPGDERLPVALCAVIGAQAARGLHAAHELLAEDGTPLSLVHRDVSPQNILIGFDGVVRVSDFGIAKAYGAADRTATGTLKGNIGYASPEQLRFHAPDRRSDLFSLGVVLYELLARRRLYRADQPEEAARRILEEPPPDIGDVRDDVPPPLVELLFDLLAKDRAARPESGAAVAARLDAVVATLATEERPFDVGAFVADRFADVRAEHAELVARALRSTAEASGVAPALPPASAAARTAVTPPPRAVRRGGRKTLVGVLAAALVATAAVAVVRWRAGAVALPGGAAGVWCGAWHTCALRGRALMCWGKNTEGQLGDTTTLDRSVRVAVRGEGGFVSAAAGHWHTCALTDGGQIWCWGRNREGQLGFDGAADRSLEPRTVSHAERATAIAAGERHTCALLVSGRVACWGGGAPRDAAWRPREVAGVAGAVAIAAGRSATCALLGSGEVRCWNAGEDAPAAPVPALSDAERLALGDGFGCAVRRGGRVACWGDDRDGQLGDGRRASRAAAADVLEIDDAVAIAAGGHHACALRRRGTVACWGRDQWGSLGDGSDGPTLVSTRPVQVVGLTDAVGVAAGRIHTCARRAEGGVSCWGGNDTGQVGDATTEQRVRPVSVVGFP